MDKAAIFIYVIHIPEITICSQNTWMLHFCFNGSSSPGVKDVVNNGYFSE